MQNLAQILIQIFMLLNSFLSPTEIPNDIF